MTLRNWFPYAMAACLSLSVLSVAATAQTVETRQRQVVQNISPDSTRANLADEPVVLSIASPEDIRRATALNPAGAEPAKFQELMLAAIDQRLGARYSWGATGPSAFDCSICLEHIPSAGISFERGSARTLWSRFAVAAPEEEVTFGTLVFFSGLRHIGIVADANGFYHASRHHGVVYSPFNDYWLSRIDGFRRVPLSTLTTAD